MQKCIAIVDDDRELQERLTEYLQEYGFEIRSCYDGDEALAVIPELQPDLVILDIMMPGKDGLEVLQELRRDSIVPILMLTARGDDMDRVVGLELGADDYLAKPFNPRELLARIKAILRREELSGSKNGTDTGEGEFRCGPLELNPGTRTLSFQDRTTELSATEFRIMEILFENKSLIISRARLMELVHDRPLESYDRSIDVQISRLRACLEKLTGSKDWIRTYRGSGYMLVEKV